MSKVCRGMATALRARASPARVDGGLGPVRLLRAAAVRPTPTPGVPHSHVQLPASHANMCRHVQAHVQHVQACLPAQAACLRGRATM